jgi:hypothetical protein
MPPTCILAADHDVGAVAVADYIATALNDGRRDMATAAGIVDFHFQRAPRAACAERRTASSVLAPAGCSPARTSVQ